MVMDQSAQYLFILSQACHASDGPPGPFQWRILVEGFQWFPLNPLIDLIVLCVSMHHESLFGFHVTSFQDKVSRPTKKLAMAHLSINHFRLTDLKICHSLCGDRLEWAWFRGKSRGRGSQIFRAFANLNPPSPEQNPVSTTAIMLGITCPLGPSKPSLA